MLSNYIFILRKKTISSIYLNEIPDIPPFFTGTLIVMGVLIFFKKKTGLSPSQAIATKNGNVVMSQYYVYFHEKGSFLFKIFKNRCISNDNYNKNQNL
jgi:hypothetical protein